MTRVVLISIMIALTSPVAAEQLFRYPAGKTAIPTEIMICRTADLVDQQVQIIPSDAMEQISPSPCGLTQEASSANIYFYRSGSSPEYIYDVVELKLWKARADGTQIYLGTFYSLGVFEEKLNEEKIGEAPPLPVH